MTPVIVRIEHELEVDPAEYRREVAPHAPAIAAVDGLMWKVWLSGENATAGGVYLFRDRASAEDYVNGPIGDFMRRSEMLRNLRIDIFDVVEEPSRITRAPVDAYAPVAA